MVVGWGILLPLVGLVLTSLGCPLVGHLLLGVVIPTVVIVRVIRLLSKQERVGGTSTNRRWIMTLTYGVRQIIADEVIVE